MSRLLATLLMALSAGAALAQDNFPELGKEQRDRLEDLAQNEKRLERISRELRGRPLDWIMYVNADSLHLIQLTRHTKQLVEDLESRAISETSGFPTSYAVPLDRKAEAARMLPLVRELIRVGASIEANPASAPVLPNYVQTILDGLRRRLTNLALEASAIRLYRFPDIPENHHIYEAFARWTRAGHIQGWSARRIFGGRSENNISMAEMLRQAIRSIDVRLRDTSLEERGRFDFVHTHELPIIESLVVEFRNELVFLGEDVSLLKSLVSTFPTRLFSLRAGSLELTEVDESEEGPDWALLLDYYTLKKAC